VFKHILFPTDSSDASFAAFPVALNLAQTYGGKITIINLHPEFISHEEQQFLRISHDHFQEMVNTRAAKARQAIEDALEQFSIDVPVEIVLREGNPRHKLCDVCGDIGGDVVVMSTQGRGKVGQKLLGSVAERVVRHSPIPVLVVHV
jgi:nucleotide-binding universal stress UspA family protein